MRVIAQAHRHSRGAIRADCAHGFFFGCVSNRTGSVAPRAVNPEEGSWRNIDLLDDPRRCRIDVGHVRSVYPLARQSMGDVDISP